MTDLEKIELACTRAEKDLGPLEFEARRALKILAREIKKINEETHANQQFIARSE